MSHRWSHLGSPLALLLVALGTAALPAVMLTMCTSRSIFNLRPDRLLGVAAACGADYLFAVMAGGVALAGYLASFAILLKAFLKIAGSSGGFQIGGLFASYPVLFGALFLMHGFCWY